MLKTLVVLGIYGAFLFSVLSSPHLIYRASAAEIEILQKQKEIEEYFRNNPDELYRQQKLMISSINETLKELRELAHKPAEFKEYLLESLEEMADYIRGEGITSSPLLNQYDQIRREILNGTIKFKKAYASLIELREKLESLESTGRTIAKVFAIIFMVTGALMVMLGFLALGAPHGWISAVFLPVGFGLMIASGLIIDY